MIELGSNTDNFPTIPPNLNRTKNV